MEMKLMLSYRVRLPEFMRPACKRFALMNIKNSNKLLDAYWSEENIDAIHNLKDENGNKLKAYKFFDCDVLDPTLLSRYRRGIGERVGEVLRSQKDRKDCFYDVLPLFLENYDLSEPRIRKKKEKAVDRIWGELTKEGKYYKFIMVDQTVRMIANYYEKEGCIPEKYTEIVKPVIKSGVFPFSVDDGWKNPRLIGVSRKMDKLITAVRLPEKRDEDVVFEWFNFTVRPYPLLEEILNTGKIKKPIFVPFRQKSGFIQYELRFPFEVSVPEIRDYAEEMMKGKVTLDNVYFKMLCVDLNERKLLALVVVDSRGEQLTPPTFIKLRKDIKEKILAIKDEIDNLNRKIRQGLDVDGRLIGEKRKLFNKLKNLANQLTHELANVLVEIASINGCHYIVFEDLRSYKPPKGWSVMSWLLSMWRRGDIITVTEYKALMNGILVKTVPAWGTSSYCPRCGKRGVHVKAPDRLNERGKKYSYFYCPSCGYKADRDYVAALNVGRRFVSKLKRIKKLEEAGVSVYRMRGNGSREGDGERKEKGAGKAAKAGVAVYRTGQAPAPGNRSPRDDSRVSVHLVLVSGKLGSCIIQYSRLRQRFRKESHSVKKGEVQ